MAENVLGVNGEYTIIRFLTRVFKANLYVSRMKRHVCAQLVNSGSKF